MYTDKNGLHFWFGNGMILISTILLSTLRVVEYNFQFVLERTETKLTNAHFLFAQTSYIQSLSRIDSNLCQTVLRLIYDKLN